jgi:hypothetical protein
MSGCRMGLEEGKPERKAMRLMMGCVVTHIKYIKCRDGLEGCSDTSVVYDSVSPVVLCNSNFQNGNVIPIPRAVNTY